MGGRRIPCHELADGQAVDDGVDQEADVGEEMRNALACAVIIFVIAAAPAMTDSQQASRGVQLQPTASSPSAQAAFVKQYCASCHNERTKAGSLALDTLDPANVEGHAETWEKVVRRLRTGMMPPEGAPKPPPAARETFTIAVESALDRTAARRLDPGAPALHRLNRSEYANGIRDLLALDVVVS